jgi:ribA/ribD-fused uncharacterized protein
MVIHGVVTKFEGEYAFLSNFYESWFTWRGQSWPTAEHAFQAAKVFCIKDGVYISEIETELEKFRNAPTPGKAKYLGQCVKIDVDAWNERRVQYMREIIHAKFMTSEESLIGPLINTGAMMLVEGNDWGDTFWGRCNGKGFNTLGVILMEERGWWSRSDEGRP